MEVINSLLLAEKEVMVSLNFLPIPPVPEEIACVAHAVFSHGNVFMLGLKPFLECFSFPLSKCFLRKTPEASNLRSKASG
jgi:hypothetical protein